jgi:signal recognition particle subunit SRP54
MFDSLSSRLQGIFAKLKGRGKLNEQQVNEAMREVRLALLEADVNYKVVKDFVARVKERAVGKEVLESQTPAQQVIKIVNEELTNLMGAARSELAFASTPPTIVMLVGLQGSGKTTSTAKLGHYFKGKNKDPFLVAADVYRPAAIDQLKALGEEANIPVFSMGTDISPVTIAVEGVKEGRSKGCDVIIIDTAGRLHIDEKMMTELQEVKRAVRPHQVLLVVDAMTGQDAVNVAVAFQEKVDFDGVLLAKLDGDARGGAALSVKAVTGRPIKFVTVGEKLDALEPFYPDRMASRILGMGDVLTFIEKAQENIDAQKAKALEEKLIKEKFNFEDFLEQMQQIQKMGPLSQLVNMLPKAPGMGKLKDLKVDDNQFNKIRAIIQSMTKEERRKPNIINGRRRERIAKGSGTTAYDVNRLIKQFEQTKKLMKQFRNFGFSGKMGKKMFPF